MDVILMGNGPFAVPLLEQFANSAHALKLVVTRPDRPQGKKLEVIPGPVAARAHALGYVVEQPENVNAADYVQRLRALGADLLVVADFGQILSPACLGSTRLGGINVHASLLPSYRGAAPVAWAIWQGETQTGVSIIQMTPSLDAGGVILMGKTPIDPNETAGELEARLSHLGAALALEAANDLEMGNAHAQPQEDARATRAPRLLKEHALIDWSRSANEIHNQIRALRPWPVAYTHLVIPSGSPLRFQILTSRPHPERSGSQTPGTVVGIHPQSFDVACGTGILEILTVKPAGKNEMDGASLLRGQRLGVGANLDSTPSA